MQNWIRTEVESAPNLSDSIAVGHVTACFLLKCVTVNSAFIKIPHLIPHLQQFNLYLKHVRSNFYWITLTMQRCAFDSHLKCAKCCEAITVNLLMSMNMHWWYIVKNVIVAFYSTPHIHGSNFTMDLLIICTMPPEYSSVFKISFRRKIWEGLETWCQDCSQTDPLHNLWTCSLHI